MPTMPDKYKEPEKEIKPSGVKQTSKMTSDINAIINKKRGGASRSEIRDALKKEAKAKGLNKQEAEAYVKKGMKLAMNTPGKTQLN